MSEVEFRKRLALWMQGVMDDKNITASEWARKAGTSPTNITRFIRERKFTPRGSTLIKLAEVVGVSPPVLGNDDVQAYTVSIIPHVHSSALTGWNGTEKLRRLAKEGDEVATVARISKNSFAVTLTENTMMLEGFIVGDKMVIDPDAKPRHGDKVAALHPSDKTVGCFKYKPPFLLARTVGSDSDVIEIKDRTILGVVVQQVRDCLA